MMEGLNKRQKKILAYLYKRFREEEDAEDANLINYLGCNPLDANTDIELLKNKGLIDVDPQFKRYISITPKGIEKLQETFFTRTKDEIYNNPLAVIAIIISVLSLLATIYINVHTSQRTESLSIDLNEVKGKLAQYDTLIVENITSNATNNKISFSCPNGTAAGLSVGDNVTITCYPKK